MKETDYRQRLENHDYQENTITAQIHRVRRVEEFHGDLDKHYAQDRMASVIEELKYSVADQRSNRPNPSKIPINGDIKSNLASYRGAVEYYRNFMDEIAATEPSRPNGGVIATPPVEDGPGQRMGLERDLQIALRSKIEQLEPGLTVIDKGAERSVDSGRLDITAQDSSGTTVVIELKAGVAGQKAVAQILSYMGDVSEEVGKRARNPRGLWVRREGKGRDQNGALSYSKKVRGSVCVLGSVGDTSPKSAKISRILSAGCSSHCRRRSTSMPGSASINRSMISEIS